MRRTGEVTKLAAELTVARVAAAADFAVEVTRELSGLAMPQARIEVVVQARAAATTARRA